MEAVVTYLFVFFGHGLALPTSCPLVSNSLSFTSTLADLTLPVNGTSLVNATELSAESTASDLYAPGDIRTQICSFGSLFNFSIEADVDEVIFTATLDILNHTEDETMPTVAYRAGPGGGQGVVLKLEPLPGIVNLTWGMWRSALLDITNYYDREGKVPIDFYINYLMDLRAILIGNGSLVHDLWYEVDED